MKKRIASGCENCGSGELVLDVLAEGLAKRDLDEVDADRMADEVGHLAAGDACGDLDDHDPTVRGCDELRKGDAVTEPERSDGIDGDLLGSLELVGGDRRGVDVHPADPEADSRWAEPVGERQQRRLASARDHDPVHLDAVHERLHHRLVRRRLEERVSEISLEVVRAVDSKDRSLAAGVDGLENRREPGRRERRSVTSPAGANRGKRRLRNPRLRERVPHRQLVRHSVGGIDPDTREPQLVRHRGHDRNGAVCRDRQALRRRDAAGRPR